MDWVLGGLVILVFGIIVAAWDAAILRSCPIDPIAMEVGPLPKAEGFWSPDSSLVGVEKIFVGDGPEDVAVDSQGRIYTGVANGWIKRIEVNGSVTDYIHTGARPLGITIAPTAEEEIYFTDTGRGLFKVSSDGTVHHLSGEVNGTKILFSNSVAVLKDGTAYFTDVSTKFGMQDSEKEMLEGRPLGRVLKYNPETGTTSVLLDHLAFVNGIALSENEDFFLISQTMRARVLRYWLKGEKEGTLETFLDGLPRLLDNIKRCDGLFYIGCPGPRTAVGDWILTTPSRRLRCMIASTKILAYGVFKLSSLGSLLVVSPEGELVKKYEDPTGQVVNFVTGGVKAGDYIYVSGLIRDFIGRLKV